MIVAIGGLFLLFGRELPVGSSFRMGPGYFPAILSWLMVALGAVMAGLAWRAPHQEGAFGAVPWRGAGADRRAPRVFFGLALRGLGLLPVLLVVVFATAWASRYASLKASAAAGAGHRRVLLGPVHQGPGPASAADRPLAERRLLVAAAAAAGTPAAATPTAPAQ